MEELKREAEATLSEAEAVAKKLCISINAFDNCCNDTISNCLRAKLTLEIEGLVGRILNQVYAKERKLSAYLRPGKEVWIQAMSVKDHGKIYYYFSATEMKKEDAAMVAVKTEQKHQEITYLSQIEFENKVNMLKSSISNGRMDQFLGLRAEQVLWEVMKQGGRLLRDVDRKGGPKRRTLRSLGHKPRKE